MGSMRNLLVDHDMMPPSPRRFEKVVGRVWTCCSDCNFSLGPTNAACESPGFRRTTIFITPAGGIISLPIIPTAGSD